EEGDDRFACHLDSWEKEFVVPPSGGSARMQPIPNHWALPPEGGTTNSTLEVVLQRELDLPRLTGGAGDAPGGGRASVRCWGAEARRIRHIEGFGPELQPAA